MIYLDNAATALQRPPCVAQAVVEALSTFGNGSRSTHPSALAAARTVYRTREVLARLFGFEWPERVVFTANATQALNTVLLGLFEPGDHLITTDWEHNSVLRPLARLQQNGVEVDYLPADRQGRLDPAEWERRLRPNTRAVVCTHASNLTGNLMDLEAVGAFAKAHGLLLVVDASQTAGSVPIDMARMHIDVLCFTGHKGLMGPQGTGGLCVVPGVQIRPLLTGGTGVRSYELAQPEEYPTHLEAGTLNSHGLAGLCAAAEYLEGVGIKAVHHHEMTLLRRFEEGVRQIPGLTLYGDWEGDRAAVAALNLQNLTSAELSDHLAQEYGIATRSGAHCAPRMHRALGTDQTGSVRFSLGWFTTGAEIDETLKALRTLAEA